ncbi:hypothetical protein [Tuwongella immobilis]|uniref:hypothetical protein n=1 Tax=Tuwongella immobilis TaxID=692036 RepID=UPI0013A6F6D4|nr:hypothetical protein [Tuwongella immobilis]
MREDALLDELLGVVHDPRQVARSRNRGIALEPPAAQVQPISSRRYFNQLRLENAAKAIQRLPVPGEMHHHIITGNFDSYLLIPAILERVARPVQELRLATLGFNRRNADALIADLHSERIQRATLIVSEYYQASEDAEVCTQLQTELVRYGEPRGWFLATRCHAKIILMRFADGPAFVVESSANLRTCRSIEQFTICDDGELYSFHASWMDQLYGDQRASAVESADPLDGVWPDRAGTDGSGQPIGDPGIGDR